MSFRADFATVISLGAKLEKLVFQSILYFTIVGKGCGSVYNNHVTLRLNCFSSPRLLILFLSFVQIIAYSEN